MTTPPAPPPPPAIARPAPPPAPSLARLTRLLIRLRLRLYVNALRRGRGRVPGLVLVMAILTSIAYLALFTQAFAAVAAETDLAGQAAALALIAGTIAFSSLAAKAAGSDAVLAGSPENEFLLARPVSLPALVVARSLAESATDPFGALFIFPLLIAAALQWNLGAVAWIVAALASVCAQIGIAAAAQAIQIAVVRYTPARRRRTIWVLLRLVAALALAALWMTGTWVLRAPAPMARGAAAMAGWLRYTPGAAIARPLVALARHDRAALALALGALAGGTVVVLAVAYAVARRAGMRGWEEAGAPWAEAAVRPGTAGARPLTAATKDLRLILRDRAQLLALVAMPIIFVGVQLFGAAGWTWSTASLGRVAHLSFSMCLYMATIGPLAHMQAERRAFWILRTVPVPLGRLMAAKARAWSAIVGGAAAIAFFTLSAGVTGATWGGRLSTGGLVVAGAVGMTWLAIALGCQAADLSDDQRPAIGPAAIYMFLLLGGLYNVVLAGDGAERLRGVVVYGFATAAFWISGIDQAAHCLDPESRLRRTVRLGDAATLVVLGDLGRRAAAAGARVAGEGGQAARLVAESAVTALVGVAAAIYLVRRKGPAARARLVPSVGVALAVGLAVAAVQFGIARPVLGGAAASSPAAGIAAALASAPAAPAGFVTALLVAAAMLLFEELVFRGVLQRAVQEWAGRRRGARAMAAAVAALIGVVASPGPLVLVALAQVAASALRAATGRASAAWLARVAIAAAWLLAGWPA